ncbi:mitogen-activated protein kinase kinase kinase 18-like [Arachis stenosperma]|uniref:mitogen-activated protein kinase kinase kinase 18-like n=1 Tax=Arachis stenosperma TaxID=217475 RepID=UPI0025ABB0D3|nr:mitogen-activated protein kinase kinase kinase 18-like [Arachis stenosperma]
MEWIRGQIIGQGSSATVCLAGTTTSAAVCAVKSAELSQSQHLQREQKILSSLSSPHIVTYKGFDITKEKSKLMFNLFMEYMPHGTLSNHGGRLLEPAIAHYTKQVLKGLEYLHSRELVHCDIKGSNILVGEGNCVKIADFGLAKSLNESAGVPLAGTPAFMSPEVARGEEQGYPCDVWGIGCTVIEMATGCSPWPKVKDPVSMLYHVGYSGEVPEIPGFLSEEAKDFLEKCLRRNPRERWSASQLLNHPFLGEFSCKDGDCVLGESNSSSWSPTSILDQGFWNSVEESECPIAGDFVQTCRVHSASDRIKKLALCSGDPNWNWESENWITTRGNNNNESSCSCIGGSMIASNSASDCWCEVEKSNNNNNNNDDDNVINSNCRINSCFYEDFKCRDVRVVVNSVNFQKMHPLTLDIL